METTSRSLGDSTRDAARSQHPTYAARHDDIAGNIDRAIEHLHTARAALDRAEFCIGAARDSIVADSHIDNAFKALCETDAAILLAIYETGRIIHPGS